LFTKALNLELAQNCTENYICWRFSAILLCFP
jgi:hypothetical protein